MKVGPPGLLGKKLREESEWNVARRKQVCRSPPCVCTNTLTHSHTEHALSHASLRCHSYAMSHQLFTEWERSHIPTEPETLPSPPSLSPPTPNVVPPPKPYMERDILDLAKLHQKREVKGKGGERGTQAGHTPLADTKRLLIPDQEIFKAPFPPRLVTERQSRHALRWNQCAASGSAKSPRSAFCSQVPIFENFLLLPSGHPKDSYTSKPFSSAPP